MNNSQKYYVNIVSRITDNAKSIQYGIVSVELKIHDGRIVSVMYSTTENTREVIKNETLL